MIARDRGKLLARCLENVRPHVDEIIVVDAGGSTDDTKEVAKSFGARVFDFNPTTHPDSFYLDVEERFAPHGIPGPYTGRHALADFAAARNFSFEQCTGDYILWLDTDDIVKNPEKLRWVAEKLGSDPTVESAFLRYEYDHDKEGNCTIRQVRERFVRRSDFQSGKVRWKLPIHETLDGLKKGFLFEEIVVVHDSPVVETITVEQNGVKVQTQHRDQIRYRNIKNLLAEQERIEKLGETLPWRLFYYLGTEMRSINPERAMGYFKQYIALSPWAEERSMSRYYMGQIREMTQTLDECWDLFAGAALEYPPNPAPWFGLARIAFTKGEWAQVIEFTEKAFAFVNDVVAKHPSLVLNPLEWQYRAHLPYSRALIEVGRIEDAKKSCESGLLVNPSCFYLNIHSKMIAERLGTVDASDDVSTEQKEQAA